MKKSKKIFIYPANNNENQYINIQEAALTSIGLSVTYQLNDFFKTEYFLLNWYETLGGNIKFDYMKKIVKLFFCKLFHKKILFVMHNKKPHNKNDFKFNTKLSIKLIQKLIKQSYKIIILSDETINVFKKLFPFFDNYINKIYKIPHPNYIGIYPINESNIRKNSNLQLLYIGQINKYKNIEYIIDILNTIQNKDISLFITGNCKDNNYKLSLLNRAKNNSNISFDFRFIPDDEIANIISKYDLLVLPYSLESSLNSGTIYLAFSYKKTVIAPYIGTLKEFNDKSLFYTYEYSSEEEHYTNLKKQIDKAYNDYLSDKNIFNYKGLQLYEDVLKNNNLDIISNLYAKLFNNLE